MANYAQKEVTLQAVNHGKSSSNLQNEPHAKVAKAAKKEVENTISIDKPKDGI